MINIDIEKAEQELNDVICETHKDPHNVKVVFENGIYSLSAESCCEDYKSNLKAKYTEICKNAGIEYVKDRFANRHL